MKKLLTLVLAAAMLTATGITAFATDVTQGNTTPSASTDVTMSVAPSYTVTIPNKVELTEQADGTYSDQAFVTATNIRLDSGKAVYVSLNSDFLLENAEGAASLAYTVTGGNSVEAIKSGDTIAVFNTDADLTKIQSSNPLDFSANKPVFAGNYSDTVTFTIRVGNI